ncbi:hypothetical protein K502DRAFT_341940 [Neoconidiobolus thromboides FSU 785]|nr:hypothetical protein K502DRAFT_341940 [Neoconidiobolus thromboides FSU 785]
MEEAIQQFLMVTGASDNNIAKSYLEMSDGDLNNAITLFYEASHLNENNSNENNRNDGSIVEDEALARSLHQRWNSAIDNNNNSTNSIEIIEDYFQQNNAEEPSNLDEESSNNGTIECEENESDNEGIDYEENESENSDHNEVEIGSEEEEDINDEEEEDINTIRENLRNQSRLLRNRRRDRIFRNRVNIPIEHRMSIEEREINEISNSVALKLNLDEARKIGKRNDRYLLLNLIPKEDNIVNMNSNTNIVIIHKIYKNEPIMQIIKNYFVFVEYYSNTSNGINYKNFYPIRSFPHFAAIDPRTGERIKVWSNPGDLNPLNFINELKLFLNQHSFNGEKLFPDLNITVSKNLDRMSEQEMLEAAIKASLNNDSYNANDDNVIEILDSEEDNEDTDSNINNDDHTMEDFECVEIKSSEEIIASVKPLELPDPKENSTRILFRLPDNTRTIKLFDKNIKVISLYQFIKTKIPNNVKDIELFMLRNNLKDKLELNLIEAEVLNSQITVTYDLIE